MSTLTWLHVSDFHVKGIETSVHRAAFDEMLRDISAQIESEGITVDAVFVTGDIAFSGQPAEYSAAILMLDSLLQACGLSGQRERLYVVPGNHDVNRATFSRSDFLLKQYTHFASTLLDPSTPYEDINAFLGLYDTPMKDWILAKFQNYAAFTREFFTDSSSHFNPEKCFSVRTLQKDGHTLTVLGLNSAWLSLGKSEQGRLLIGEKQVTDALEEARTIYPEALACIALMHHPIYWLAEADIAKVQQYIPVKCAIVLRGHLHCPSVASHSTPDSTFHEMAAGASLGASYQAYNLVQVDLATAQATAIVRLHHPDIGGHWGPDCFTYRSAVKGKLGLDLKLSLGVTV